MSRTLLVDGNNLLARADFAAKGRVALSSNGTQTATLLLFVNMLSKYVRLTKPDRVCVLWDGGHAFRDEAYPAYKANRKPRVEGEEPIPFAQAKEFLSWAGVPHKQRTGWEADDLIAMLARAAAPEDEVVILSGDRDMLQLVQPGVTQIMPPEDLVWDVARVKDKYGYGPHQIPLVKALVGDTGDNVPGVRGIGPKKASALLDKAGWDWEAALDLLEPEKAAEARTARLLVDLRYLDYAELPSGREVSMTLTVPPFTPTEPSHLLWDVLLAFLQRLEMNSVVSRLMEGALWEDAGIAPVTDASLFEGV